MKIRIGQLPFLSMTEPDHQGPDRPVTPSPPSPRRTRWPRGKGEVWIPFTDEMRSQVKSLLKQSGFSVASLLDGATDLPESFTVRTLRGWLHGEVKSLNAAHWTYVLARLANPPKGKPAPIIRPKRTKIAKNFPDHRLITAKERAALMAQRKRTGLGGARLLAGAADTPAGLTAAMIAHWLSGKSKSADPAHLEYVLRRYASVRTRRKRKP